MNCKRLLGWFAGLAGALLALSVGAQVKIGVIASSTGAIPFVGIPQKNAVALLPKKMGDFDVEYLVFDDASDPTQTVQLAKKLDPDVLKWTVLIICVVLALYTALRRDLGYPPFSRMINLIVSGTGKEQVEKGAGRLGQRAARLAAGDDFKGRLTVIGPMEAPLGKVRGRYRQQLLVRGKQVRPLHAFVRQLVEGADIAGCEIRVDVDPMNFM